MQAEALIDESDEQRIYLIQLSLYHAAAGRDSCPLKHVFMHCCAYCGIFVQAVWQRAQSEKAPLQGIPERLCRATFAFGGGLHL